MTEPWRDLREAETLERAFAAAEWLETMRTYDMPTDPTAEAAFAEKVDEQIRLGRVKASRRESWLQLWRQDPQGAADALAELQGLVRLESNERTFEQQAAAMVGLTVEELL